MRVVFKNYPLSNHDVWLCAITLAAVKMLRPRTGKILFGSRIIEHRLLLLIKNLTLHWNTFWD